ncbi:MAG: hypothetical protein ACKOX2_05990, partial [Microcystaceae cyanobacterium]
MGTEFVNKVIAENQGEITTLSEWSVWDCIGKKWSSSAAVVLRNILLAANHPKPEERFCIGEIPEKTTDPASLNAFKPPGQDSKPYFLDLASGSRTHGRFTFSLAPTIGRAYYGEDWKRIIYGSIMHTGCKKMVYRMVRFAVTDDADDPVYNTGDSHAKATAEFMSWLGLPLKMDEDPDAVDNEVPVQFRCSEFQKWVGKGTVAYNPDMDGGDVDIAIPLSSCKGNKPPLGKHEAKLLFGVVFEAEERRAKVGWMLLQWFSFETLEADNIIARLEQKAQKLRDAYNNIQSLAETLRISQEEAEQELKENDTLQSEAEYENTMMRIIRADGKGVLLLHPYVVRRVKERMRAVWLNLAKSAGMRFFSLMTQPDESFKKYHIYKDGKIGGGKFFCAKDFPEGEYIVCCNPRRHWGDVQLWRNKHE